MSEVMSRRTTLALLGLGGVLGLAGSSLVTASEAEAQTVGMERRQIGAPGGETGVKIGATLAK